MSTQRYLFPPWPDPSAASWAGPLGSGHSAKVEGAFLPSSKTQGISRARDLVEQSSAAARKAHCHRPHRVSSWMCWLKSIQAPADKNASLVWSAVCTPRMDIPQSGRHSTLRGERYEWSLHQARPKKQNFSILEDGT